MARRRVLRCSILTGWGDVKMDEPERCGERAKKIDATYKLPVCSVHILELRKKGLTAMQSKSLLVGLGMGTQFVSEDERGDDDEDR